jgi:zinc protease
MKKIGVALAIWACLAAVLAAQQDKFRKTPPPPDPLQKFDPPRIELARLVNGLGVSVVYRENLPFVSLQLILQAGESASPDDLPGLATYALSMLPRSTQFLSSSDIEERIEASGGTLSVSVTPDYAVLRFQFLEEYLDQALDLLSQMILQPGFSDRESASVKLSATYDLLAKEKNTEFVARRQMLRLLFTGHPYEKYAFKRSVIKNWNLKSLLNFFDGFYRPNNAQLVIAGNLNMNTATRKVSHVLATWEKRDRAPAVLPPVRPPEKERICLIDVPKAKDATVYFGTVVPSLTGPDRFALTVLNQALGGTPISRLFMNLRESQALAYEAFSEVQFFRACGVLFIRARVTPEGVAPSIREIEKEIMAAANAPMPALEIEQAKSYLIGNFPVKIQNFEAFSARAAEAQAENSRNELWTNYCEQVMLVSAESVFASAQKYLLQPFLIVIAGDKSVLSDRLAEFEAFDVYDNQGQFLYTVKIEKKGAENEARGMRPELQRRPGSR